MEITEIYENKKLPCMIIHTPIFPLSYSDSDSSRRNMGFESKAFENFLWNLEQAKPKIPTIPPKYPPVMSFNLPDTWGVVLPSLPQPAVYLNISEPAT